MNRLKTSLLLLMAALTGCLKHIPTNPTPTPHARTVTLNWNASTTPGVTYNAYRIAEPCPGSGTFTKINTAPISALTYDDLNVPTGTYCYYVTAYLASATPPESTGSNKAEAIVTDTQPNPPSGLSVNPVKVTLNLGTQQQFTAMRGAEPATVTWSINPPDEGSMNSVTGLYTTPSKIQGNNVRVQVLAQDAGGWGTADITLRK